MATEWQKRDIAIPDGLSERQRLQYGELVIDYIQERTAKGEGENGSKLPGPYSKSYQESHEFEVAGKSPNKINMELTGEMVNNIDILSTAPGRLTYGFERGSDENAKADGNIRGTYGTSTPDSKKARDFLTLGDSDKAEIDKRFAASVGFGRRSQTLDTKQQAMTFLAVLSKTEKIKRVTQIQNLGLIDGRINVSTKSEPWLEEMLARFI